MARILALPGDTATILKRFARAAVPGAADFCFIFLVDDGHLPCVASAHATPAGERLLRRLNRVYKITRSDPVSTVAQVVRSGRPRLRGDITDEPSAPLAELQRVTLHQRLGARSALVVPIGAPPGVLGALSLSYAGSGRHYTAQDVPRARRLAGLIAAFLRKRGRAVAGDVAPPLVARRPLRLRARL